MNAKFLSWAVGIAVLTSTFMPTLAQDKPSVPYAPLAYIPNPALGYVHVNVYSTLTAPTFRLAPLEVLSAAGMEQFGIDPMDIDTIDLAIGAPGPAGPEFGAIVTLRKALDVNDLNEEVIDSAEAIETDGKKFFPSKMGPIAFHQLSDKQVLVGTMSYLQLMLSGPREAGSLAQFAAKANLTQSNIVALVDVRTIGPMLQGGIRSSGAPPQVSAALNSIVGSTDLLAIRGSVDTEAVQILFQGADEAAGQQIENAIMALESFGEKTVMEQTRASNPGESLTNKATITYTQRLMKEFLTELAPKRSKERVVVQLSMKDKGGWMTTGVLGGLLLPAVQQARSAAQRVTGANNLRQIGLAAMNYEATYGKLPANIVDKNGKQLLSWRVAILPYLEQQSLYEKFHLDEPWDSEHNSQLIKQMPEFYKHPSLQTLSGETIYQMPSDDGTGVQGMKVSTIRDGTSNTALVIEAPTVVAAPWSAPQDLKIGKDDPLLMWNNASMKNFHVLRVDGSVQLLNIESMPPEVFWGMLTPNGAD